MKPIKTTGIQDKFTVKEDRCMEYREFRMNLRLGRVQDIDQLEYRVENGIIIPKAIIELSKVEGKVISEPAYFRALLKNRKNQIECVKAIAARLEIDAWYIIYEDSFKRMWVLDMHNLTRGFVEAEINDVRKYLIKIHGG